MDTSKFFDAIGSEAHDWKGPLSHDVAVDSPIWGPLPWRRFAASMSEWLRLRSAVATVVASVSLPERTVTEYVLRLDLGGEEIDLPVAVVFAVGGGKISAVRLYHATSPLEGEHPVRKSTLAPAPGLAEPPVVKAYFHSLDRGDLKGVLATFTESGVVREPGGADRLHAGAEGRKAYFEGALRDGGIGTKHLTATSDGRLCAVEYACDRRGHARFEPRPGLTTCALDPVGGHLAAVRIYDEIRA
jgi:ketosteroid isomerase-like protein